MTLQELIDELQLIVKVHPESAEHMIEVIDDEGHRFHVDTVGWDKKRRCVKLCE